MSKRVNNLIAHEIVDLVLGKRIDGGISRNVYENLIDPTTVIKIEDSGYHMQNALEMATWNDCVRTKLEKWLAPCVFLSPCYKVLIQKKTTPLRKNELPKKMPSILTDFQQSNYGWFEGRIVCHDYGTNLAINHAACDSKMRKVEHWN